MLTVQEAQPEPVPVPPPALDPLTLVEEERSPVKKRKKKEDEEDPSGDIDNVGLPQVGVHTVHRYLPTQSMWDFSIFLYRQLCGIFVRK